MANIPEILKSSHTIAVVGLSGSPMRVSNGVAEYMQRAGYRIEDLIGRLHIAACSRRAK